MNSVDDIRDILKEEKILEFFKRVSVKDFEKACNEDIGRRLNVGDYYDIAHLHDIIIVNIRENIVNFLSSNGVDYSILRNFFNTNTWYLRTYFNYDEIGVWEEIGNYKIEWHKRKNASISNSNVKLLNNPIFIMEVRGLNFDKNISLYDFAHLLVEKKKNEVIKNLNTKYNDIKRELDDITISKKKFENIEIKF